jgi:hypothetical protein
MTPLNILKLYNTWAFGEFITKEFKMNYSFAKILTVYFYANKAYSHFLLFLYNLINWFKRLSLPAELQNAPLNTL